MIIQINNQILYLRQPYKYIQYDVLLSTAHKKCIKKIFFFLNYYYVIVPPPFLHLFDDTYISIW